MRFLLLFFGFLFCCIQGYGQDTVIPLPEVKISSDEKMSLKPLDINSQTFSRELMLLNQPEDVGVLLQRFSGVTMRNYGGLGGLKTISVKGLGSCHTSFLIDGFTLNNTQTGQINLGQIQTDNLESISLNSGSGAVSLLPASSFVSGSSVSINTFENNFSEESLKIRMASKIGSFGEVDSYVAGKFSKKRIFISAFGKYREAKGDYAYLLQNGNFSYEGIRFNNDLKDWYSGASFGIKFKNSSKFRVLYKNNGVDQGLPGAVILYNTMANQRLNTKAHVLNTDYVHHFKLIDYRVFGTYQTDQIQYTDPYFLNNTGGISSVYINNSYQVGVSVKKVVLNCSSLFGGAESRYSDLSFSTLNSAVPKRLHSFGLIGFNWFRTKWVSEFQLSVQQISEENDAGERAENRLKINPFVSIEKLASSAWKLKVKGWYRNSFRMPTFNELYYNGIGNVKLKPEEAHQFSFGFSMQPLDQKLKITVVSNGFANRVENQILAIPTKNLFVWSMQNIGSVNTFGNETRMQISRTFGLNWYSEAIINYTYQYSVDVTKSSSPTYLHQVAYVPRHTGNVDFTLKRKNAGLHFSSTLSSYRYSLTENIVANKINGFAICDASVFAKFSLANKHSFRLSFAVKNIFNTSYAYVRYFVMPGRNYLITLNYALF